MAVIYLIGGYLKKATQRVSMSESGVLSPLPGGPDVPVRNVMAASAAVDNRTRITLTGGQTIMNERLVYHLVWHLETSDVTPQWTRGPDLHIKRFGHISFWLAGNLYVGMGTSSGSIKVSSLEMLDTSQPSPLPLPNWRTSLPSYPLNVSFPTCVLMQGQAGEEVWVMGGESQSGITNAVYSWRGPGHSWQEQPSMIKARYGHSSVINGGRIWVMGGYKDATVEMYNEGTWSLVSPMPDPSFDGAAVMWHDHLVQLAANGFLRSDAYVMNITTNSWTVSKPRLYTSVYRNAAAFITP